MKTKFKNIFRFFITGYLLLVISFYFFGCATAPKIDVGMPTINLNGSEYISVIEIADKFNLSWDYDTILRKVVLTRGANEIRLMSDSRIILVNGNPVDLHKPVEMSKSQIFVPVRFKQDVLDVLFGVSGAPVKTEQAPLTDFNLIALDAGHGGNDPGAIGRHGLREKDVNLDIAQRVKRILEAKGFKVVMTRNSDKFIPLPKRAQIANDAKADLFVSFHVNANPSRKLSGF